MVDQKTTSRGSETTRIDEERREVTERLIADLRRRLLDLTNRNRLLNFKFSERARTHIRLVDELPDALCEKLLDGRTLAFTALPEPEDEPKDEKTDRFLMALAAARRSDQQYLRAIETLGEGEEDETSAAGQRIERALKDRVRESLGLPIRAARDTMTPTQYAERCGIAPSYDLPTPSDVEDDIHHRNNRIQTLLFPDQMERKLSGIRDGAKAAQQEMGVDILFAAFGFIEWYESQASQRKLFAPLLLYPVEMDRSLVGQTYRYSIKWTGDDPQVNIALRERLLGDFGLALPSLEEGDSPERYFATVQDGIRDRPRWCVRRFITIGLFSFARIAMYHDLDPARWPDDRALDRHPVLLDLFGGSEKSQSVFADDYEVDAPEVARKVPLLISEADSSQFSAIVDVMDGKNLAIKGPPGTGKSQTITNTIAAALANGKRVLFVAEKMAALDVVKKRLDDAQLGEFCLELHSARAQKKAVVESLRQRRELIPCQSPTRLVEKIEEQERCRDDLTRYVEIMNAPCGATARTLHDHVWAYLRAADRARQLQLPSLEPVRLEVAANLRETDCENCVSTLETLEKCLARFGERYGHPNSHPWRGVRALALSPFEQQDLITAIRGWLSVITDATEWIRREAAGLSLPNLRSIHELRELSAAASALFEQASEELWKVLPQLSSPDGMRSGQGFADLVREHQKRCEKVKPMAACDPASVDLEAVRALRDLSSSLNEHAPLTGLRIDEIPVQIKHYTSLARRAHDYALLSEELGRLSSFASPLTVEAFSPLLEAVEIVRETPATVLTSRSAELLSREASAKLQSAAQTAKLLRENRQQLSDRFNLPDGEDAPDYRRYAEAFRSIGWPRTLWSRDVRAARRLWKTLRKSKTRLAKQEIAKVLDGLADHFDTTRAFSNDPSLTSICCSHFAGIDTNFDLLLSTNSYGGDVVHRFPTSSSANLATRRLLLEGDTETLMSLLLLVDHQTAERLKQFLSAASPWGSDLDLAGLERLFTDVATKLQKVDECADSLQISDSVRLRALNQLAHDLETAKSSAEHVNAHDLARFAGDRRNYEATLKAVVLANDVYSHRISPELARWLLSQTPSERTTVQQSLHQLGEILAAEAAQCQAAVEGGDLDLDSFLPGLSSSSVTVEQLRARLSECADADEELPPWLEYNRVSDQVAKLGLSEIISRFDATGAQLRHSAVAFWYGFHRAILRQAYKEHAGLSRFGGITQQEIRDRFRGLDRDILQLRRRELAAGLANVDITSGHGWGPKKDWSDLALIDNELSKKKRHIPLRDLLYRAGNAVQQMKPCWMMSPASVAQFLRPEGVRFDLVVMDEASQVKPEDALGAIGRATQLVVVGDPQQLPPTSFFDRLDFPDEDNEAIEDYIDTESILDMALATFHPARNLRWHYRSRHESLIAFSNQHFYDGTLVVFPSPRMTGPDLGVEYRKIKGAYTPKASTNISEALQVAEAAIDFMTQNVSMIPHVQRSLGIVAMNQPQRDIIMEEIDRLCAKTRLAEEYRKKWDDSLEPFFVKNLENVQGDERDVIFISTVYGPDQLTGKLAQRFGPINSNVGHRRLNVLFTRAKEKVVVFSSMESTDIILADPTRRGVATLKNYLSYAKNGLIDPGTTTGREPQSDFEVFVADRLRAHGFEVTPQVGVGGYFIDLAIKHPEDPSTYILGVECDGATYHSSKSARDRDCLRQAILERLGWRLYRIWSTDWFANPEKEARRLIELLSRMVARPTDSGPPLL